MGKDKTKSDRKWHIKEFKIWNFHVGVLSEQIISLSMKKCEGKLIGIVQMTNKIPKLYERNITVIRWMWYKLKVKWKKNLNLTFSCWCYLRALVAL